MNLDEQKKILIIGGSQGAKFFDEFISKIILKLSKIKKLKILQQVAGQKSRENISKVYQKSQIEHELFEFDAKLLSKAALSITFALLTDIILPLKFFSISSLI